MPDAVLADVLGRLSTALAAGIDLRRAWDAESRRVPRRWQGAMRDVGGALGAGETLSEALAAAGAAFPPLVRGMARVGERTGRDAEILRETAAALTAAVRGRKALRAGLVRPAVQLAAAVAATAVVIAVSGGSLDMLGLGLAGPGGAAVFLGAVLAVVAGLGLTVRAAAASWRTGGWARLVAGRMPGLGNAIRAGEAAAWCRAAAMAAHAGLPVGELVRLAAAAAPGLALDAEAVERRLRDGEALDAALRAERRLPRDVIRAVGVGELTGTTAESLDRVADTLADNARRGVVTTARAAGFAAWAAVATLVALLVVRLMRSYVGIIDDAGRLP